jgi:hypothetical protein
MAPTDIERLHGHAYIDALLAWELRSDAELAPQEGPATAAPPQLARPLLVGLHRAPAAATPVHRAVRIA